jgi:hypothetical protein
MSWLKFDTATPEKPEVLQITIDLGWDDPDLTVGKLLKVWRWFDAHSVNGNAKSVTPALLDRLIGVTGLCGAMVRAGWMIESSDGLTLPNFENHNGKTAKDRALTAKRVGAYRVNGNSNVKCNDASVTSALPREEKRREENITKETPLPPKGGEYPPEFLQFWDCWPKHHRKQAQGKCFDAWKKSSIDQQRIIEHVESLKNSNDWKKDNGDYIPAPLVYLNQKRWEGVEQTAGVNIFAGAI